MPRARSRRDLSLDEIVTTARQVLSDEGSFSMRRIADACGVTPMALYHHVPDKEALEDLVIDQILREVLAGIEPTEWRAGLIEFACAFRNGFVHNPGAGAIFIRRPVVVPSSAALTESMFRLLAMGGVRGLAAAQAADAIVLLLLGSIVNDLTRPARVRDRLVAIMGPEVTRVMEAELEAYTDRDPEARFRNALEWLIDGVASARP